MMTDQMNKRLWRTAYQLAAELAQRNFDDNILKAAGSYLRQNPDGDLLDWAERLAQLGEIFRSSNQTTTHRQEFWAACHRLKSKPRNREEWIRVLFWAARLHRYFVENRQSARAIAPDAHALTLSHLPPLYQPPPVVRAASAAPSTDVPPEPPPESTPPNDLTQAILAALQAKEQARQQKKKHR